ncbi:TonB-dependent receptor plug domain-containing protein, partial [uncultured Muribaculum sp.]
MTVHLAVKSEMMDEVMVVAFGKQKRESFTGSASVLSADAISKQQVTNPIEALDGLVTGLQMTQTNSFGSDPSILIRGIGSINASTAPLIVLDGLPYNGYWNDINPADIQNITVLKDAASNALYGARCANGVILITTKSAQRGETRVNITAKWGVNTDGRIQYDYIDNPGEYYAAHYTALRNYLVNVKKQNPGQAHINANRYIGESASEGHGGLGYMVYNVPAGEFLIGTNGQLNPNAVLGNRVAYQGRIYTLYPDNWLENGTRNGFRQEYNVNITGGNDRYTILGNFGYLKEDGLTYGNDFDRISARIKTDYQAYDFLRIGGNASYNHTVTNVQSAAFGTTYTAPIYPLFIRDADGN